MKQRHQRPSTTDELGLSAWARTTAGTAGDLGSLSGALGEFLPAPPPRFVMPAQRSSTVLEVLR
jgi:hypothetical protein